MEQLELTAYMDAIQRWRDEQDVKLRSETGWLTVVGLFWLNEGENTVGSDASADVVLPASTPSHLGVMTLNNNVVTFQVTADDSVLIDGVEGREATLHYSLSDTTKVQVGDVTFFVIRRGDQIGVRVRDANSEARRNFTGRTWFPVDLAYRVTGTFRPHSTEQTLEVETILGTSALMSNPGSVVFELDGQTHEFEAFEDSPGSLWFVFRDSTAGQLTYSVGRFLYTTLHEDGSVILDFNKAILPPCAFTIYATCPLPPKKNILSIPIMAGESGTGIHL